MAYMQRLMTMQNIVGASENSAAATGINVAEELMNGKNQTEKVRSLE